jgi:opacity protein-like surface antigen
MKRILCALVVLMFCMAGAAHALEGFYIAPKLGYSLLNFDDPEIGEFGFSDDDDDVWGGGLALGYDMRRKGGIPIRVEVEGFIRESGEATWPAAFGEGTVRNRAEVATLFANAFFDIPLGWIITPYVGGGLGVAWVDYRTSGELGFVDGSASDDRTNFAWNLGAGLAWEFTQNMALDFNYRYVDAGEGRVSTDLGRSESDIFLHEFLLGLRFTF